MTMPGFFSRLLQMCSQVCGQMGASSSAHSCDGAGSKLARLGTVAQRGCQQGRVGPDGNAHGSGQRSMGRKPSARWLTSIERAGEQGTGRPLWEQRQRARWGERRAGGRAAPRCNAAAGGGCRPRRRRQSGTRRARSAGRTCRQRRVQAAEALCANPARLIAP